jgi:membrane associated rhomboid family serine protease
MPTNTEPKTCSKCGALVGAERVRCHACGNRLSGFGFDDAFFRVLVPERFSSSPATALLCLLLIGWYLVIAVVTSGDSLAVMSSYTARAFGSLDSSWVEFGQYWRTLGSVFLHHDLIHLSFNIYAFAIAGPIFERFYDSRRLVAAFVICGALSMACSHFWFELGLLTDATTHHSLGASGAICGIIGANLVAAKRIGPSADPEFRRMLIWIALLVLIGLGFAGARLDNAAHIGGLIAGALFATLVKPIRLRENEEALGGRAWSVVMYASIVAILLTMGVAISNVAGIAPHLERDGYGRTMFFFKVSDGAPWEFSGQNRLYQSCRDDVLDDEQIDGASATICRENVLANSHDSVSWLMYAEVLRATGSPREVRRALKVANSLDD